MESDAFLRVLSELTPATIHDVARSLDSGSTADEVDAWRTTIAIDRALRHAHTTRRAAQAAWTAAQTVQRAATAGGIALPDQQVTQVARAAAEVARGLVAGDAVAPEVSRLLVHWFPLVVRAA